VDVAVGPARPPLDPGEQALVARAVTNNVVVSAGSTVDDVIATPAVLPPAVRVCGERRNEMLSAGQEEDV
jgi:hypothetical protein